MNLPYWLLKLLPMWDCVCPKCRKEVKQKTHRCVYCGENYGTPLRVPPRALKEPKALEEYVHSHVFPKVSQQHRDYLARFFTIIFADDWETAQDFTTNWTTSDKTVGCTIEIESNHPHHGTHNAHALSVGNAGDWASCRKTFAASSVAYARMYVKFNQINIVNGSTLDILVLNSGTNSFEVSALVYNAAGTFIWGIDTHENAVRVVTVGTHTPSTGIWYCVEIRRDVTNDLQDLWIDGVLEVSTTRTITTNTVRVVAGIYYQWSAGVNELYFDCVVVADAYIGPEIPPPIVTQVRYH